MILNSLNIENFKCFKNAFIPLKPLTLIYGKNSAGKSTILNAILLAANTLGYEGVKPFNESFVNCVYNHDESLDIILTLNVDVSEKTKNITYSHDGKIFSISSSLSKIISDNCRIKLVFGKGNEGPKLSNIEYVYGNEVLCVVEQSVLGRRFTYLDLEHDIFNRNTGYVTLLPLFKALINNAPLNCQCLKGNVSIYDITQESLFWAFKELSVNDQKIIYQLIKSITNSDHAYNLLDDLVRDSIDDFVSLIQRVSSDCTSTGSLQGLLSNLFHLGPLREIPSMEFDLDITTNSEGLSLLNNLAVNENVEHLVDIRDINDWLLKLNTGYAIKVTDNYNFSNDGLFYDSIIKMKLNPTKKSISKAIEEFERLRRSKRNISLIDINKNIEVYPNNVGVGISQVLPVIIQSLLVQKVFGINAIEQPELHLHPAFQAELGDLFVATRTFQNDDDDRLYDVITLLETHSEHLLLRIMRRIRETAKGTICDDNLRISNSDVVILYVDSSNNESVVREMPLNEYGELIKPWPGGFFEEGLREVF